MGVLGPGPLTTSGAEALTDFVRRTQANADALARRTRKSERFIPAQVTAYDAGTNAYTWHERAIASDGTRYDKPNGRSGSPTYGPAYGVGDGNDALLTIPADVTLRMATVTTTLGPVYEFSTVCACIEGAGGSGTEDVFTFCCPNRLPRFLTATLVVTSGTCVCVDGATTTLEYGNHGGPSPYWLGFHPALCGGTDPTDTLQIQVVCVGPPFALVPNLTTSGGTYSLALPYVYSWACDPLAIRIGPWSTTACPGATFDLVITA